VLVKLIFWLFILLSPFALHEHFDLKLISYFQSTIWSLLFVVREVIFLNAGTQFPNLCYLFAKSAVNLEKVAVALATSSY